MSALQDQLDALAAALVDVNSQLAAVDADTEALEAQLATSLTALGDAQSQITVLETQNTDLTTERDALQAIIDAGGGSSLPDLFVYEVGNVVAGTIRFFATEAEANTYYDQLLSDAPTERTFMYKAQVNYETAGQAFAEEIVLHIENRILSQVATLREDNVPAP